MTMRLAVPPAAAKTWRVQLRPPALAMMWLGPGRRHEAVAVPGVALAEGEALIAVELATVSGADVRAARGDRPVNAPLVLGHEAVGRVVAVSGDVPAAGGRRIDEGDRVVWSHGAACGRCDRCGRGLPHLCRHLCVYGSAPIAPRWELTGGFATHAHLRPGTTIVRVAENTPAAVLAPASGAGSAAWAAVDRADRVADLPGALTLVTGAGAVGLLATAMATDRGARVVVADPDPARRDLAHRFGAVAAVEPGDHDALAHIVAAHGDREIDVVVEASGSPDAAQGALRTVGAGGVIVLTGGARSTLLALDAADLAGRHITVRGVDGGGPADLVAAAGYLQARYGTYPFAALVGERMPLVDVDAALAAAGRAGSPVRIGLDPALAASPPGLSRGPSLGR